MLLTAFPLLPKLISFIPFFADVKHVFLLSRYYRGLGSLGSSTLLLLDSLAWLRVDMYDHAWALIAIVSTLKLLKHQR